MNSPSSKSGFRSKLMLWAGMLVLAGGGLVSAQTPLDSLVPDSSPYADSILRPVVIKPHPFLLPLARVSVQGSYPLELSFTKTTHIVFPSKIKDFDAGSGSIVAMVPETILNVLRVKSDTRGFLGETNMTVFTEDGRLYSFLVRYNEHPVVFTVMMAQNETVDRQTTEELGIAPGAFRHAYVLPEGTFNQAHLLSNANAAGNQRNFIRRVGGRTEDFSVRLKGLFLDSQQVMYLKLELKNRSYMPYHIDFIKLFVRDRNTVKRMALQQEEVPLLLSYPVGVTHLNGAQRLEKVLAIPFKTLSEGKVLEIEVYEKSGGRHVTFRLTNRRLLEVKPIF